jgi:hypothetical protein
VVRSSRRTCALPDANEERLGRWLGHPPKRLAPLQQYLSKWLQRRDARGIDVQPKEGSESFQRESGCELPLILGYIIFHGDS